MAHAHRIWQELIEEPFQHHRLALAHGKDDGLACMRLRAFLLHSEILIDDELQAVFTFNAVRPQSANAISSSFQVVPSKVSRDSAT